jgi:hypothetical protein
MDVTLLKYGVTKFAMGITVNPRIFPVTSYPKAKNARSLLRSPLPYRAAKNKSKTAPPPSIAAALSKEL